MKLLPKITAILIAVIMVCGLAACAPKAEAPAASSAASSAAPSAAASSEAPSSAAASSEAASSAAPSQSAEGDIMSSSYRLTDVEAVQLKDSAVAAKVKKVSVKPVDVSSGKKIKVGYSQMEVNNTWRIVNNDSVQKAFAASPYELIYRDAQSSIEKQNRDVTDLLNEGVDYLIICPYEYEGLAPALAEAKKKGVPVILSDREAAGTPGEDFVTAILGDFVDVGYKAGQTLRKAFGDKKISVVEITGTAGSSVARDLSAGFKMFMEEDKNMELVASADGNFGRKESLSAMQNIIQAYNGKFNAVFGHVDDAAIAAIQALKEAGLTPGPDPTKDQIPIVSMCGYKDAFDAIIAGEQLASIECTARFGPALVDIITRLQEGKEIATRLVMPCKVYDASNAKQLYNEALK